MKEIYIIFCNLKLERKFESLELGTSEEKRLYSKIDKAIKSLKKNFTINIKIHKSLWPKTYIQKYRVNNLWKYNLPNGWRLIYTIKNYKEKNIIIILEWLNHKEYERRFRY